MRYVPIVRFIEEKRCKKILEVGSGDVGLSEFFSGNFTGCDLISDQERKIRPKKMVYRKGNIEELPFGSNSYDLVICVDVFEHLNKKSYFKATAELLRVSKKYIILASPMKRTSFLADKLLYKVMKLFNLKIPKWMIEHLSTKICKEELVNILNKFNYVLEERPNECLFLHILFILLDSIIV